MTISAPAIELTNVAVQIGGRRLLSGISFHVMRGEFVYLHGPTGSGKSLVLRLIAGLTTATSGEVRVGGDLVNDMTDSQRLWLRRSSGIMVQESMLLPDRTVLKNVMLPALAAAISYREARQRAYRALEKCHVAHLADARPGELSAGQRQIACVARAVVNAPAIILADEPAAHLDVRHAQTLMDLLGEFSLGAVSVVVASHLEVLPRNVAYREVSLGDEEESWE